MNGKDLLTGMSFVSSKYVDEAENAMLAAETRRPSPLRTKRTLLIAAVVALMLMLVGCTVAYVLNMQNMKVGSEEIDIPVFDEDNTEFLGYETVSNQVLTLAGIKGSETIRPPRSGSISCRAMTRTVRSKNLSGAITPNFRKNMRPMIPTPRKWWTRSTKSPRNTI